jgi:hypothetical protein
MEFLNGVDGTIQSICRVKENTTDELEVFSSVLTAAEIKEANKRTMCKT